MTPGITLVVIPSVQKLRFHPFGDLPRLRIVAGSLATLPSDQDQPGNEQRKRIHRGRHLVTPNHSKQGLTGPLNVSRRLRGLRKEADEILNRRDARAGGRFAVAAQDLSEPSDNQRQSRSTCNTVRALLSERM